MTKMARAISQRLARLMANMYYVGALAHLLGIEDNMIQKAVEGQFKGKEKAIEMNLRAISESRAYAEENWDFQCPKCVEEREKNPDTILTVRLGEEDIKILTKSEDDTRWKEVPLPSLPRFNNNSTWDGLTNTKMRINIEDFSPMKGALPSQKNVEQNVF